MALRWRTSSPRNPRDLLTKTIDLLTMDKSVEAELFVFLSGQPRYREWLTAQLQKELEVLVLNNDVEQIRRAQGKAQLLQKMIELLDKSKPAQR